MRAEVERNSESGTDVHNNPLPPNFEAHATLPCFAWSNQSRQVIDGDKTAVVEDLRALFALGADIAEGDEIVAIKDRRGVVLIPGRLRVDAKPQRKHRHLEAALRRVS